MFLKNLNHNSYKPLTIQDKRLFIATLNAVQKLALSMIANGVIVLPSDRRRNVKKTHLLHYFITKKINKTKKNDRYIYQDVMTTKQVILACIEKDKREYFDTLINSVMLLKKNNNNSKSSKILLYLNKQIFKKLNKEAKARCINDIVFIEKNINTINNKFKQNLPNAKKAGKILLSKMTYRINTVPKSIKIMAKE